jgi:hypothetical protein
MAASSTQKKKGWANVGFGFSNVVLHGHAGPCHTSATLALVSRIDDESCKL